MKHKLLLLLFLASTFSLSAQDKEPIMVFKNSDVDLGVVPLKGSKNAVYYYTNEGKSPIIILEAKSSCGCTSVKYNRRPTAASATDSVVITYKPDAVGVFYKKVILKNSAGEKSTLIVKGVVK